MRKVLLMGAGGRDFHDFNVVYRHDESATVIAFTASQIPGIENRRYPRSLAGDRYPEGIPIRPEAELDDLIRRYAVDDVVLSYSDLRHVDVMHKASRVLAAGAAFRLLSPDATMLASSRPVVAVCATRTGSGKSQTSRRIASILTGAGLRVVLVRHPMPYGDLEAMRVQRFATLEDIDASDPTIEEREEYEEPVRNGIVVYAGVDYEAILRRAEQEADVIVWDGGNNDTPFYRPDLWITVADPLRAGHELAYHPGEVNLRRADVVVINKLDTASLKATAQVVRNVGLVNARATVIRAASPVTLEDGPALDDRRVLVVEDGPTLTHGEMAFGAGAVAARQHGAHRLVDPRPFAAGSLADMFRRYPHIGKVLPAMGYGATQLGELQNAINASGADVVVTGTPIDLRRVIQVNVPIRHARYELREIGHPNLDDVLAPHIERWHKDAS
jgi:predicted GTPase